MTSDDDLEAAGDMNTFLRKHALDQAKRGVSQTFVLCDDRGPMPRVVVAYYSVATGQLLPADLPKVVSPRMTVPTIVLQRFAVDRCLQRKGLGTKLFVDFFIRAIRVATEVGVHALVLEPLSERVREFYARFGFRPLPGDPGRMYATLRGVRAWLSAHDPNAA